MLPKVVTHNEAHELFMNTYVVVVDQRYYYNNNNNNKKTQKCTCPAIPKKFFSVANFLGIQQLGKAVHFLIAFVPLAVTPVVLLVIAQIVFILVIFVGRFLGTFLSRL